MRCEAYFSCLSSTISATIAEVGKAAGAAPLLLVLVAQLCIVKVNSPVTKPPLPQISTLFIAEAIAVAMIPQYQLMQIIFIVEDTRAVDLQPFQV